MLEKAVGYHVGDQIICTFCFESHMPPDSRIFRGDIEGMLACCDVCNLPLGAWDEFYAKWEINISEIDHTDAEASQGRERNLVRLIASAVQRKLQKNESTSFDEKYVESDMAPCFELDLEKILDGTVS